MRWLAIGVYRFSAILLLSVGCCIAAPPALAAENATAISEYQPGTPFTYLFDTRSRSARPLSPKALAAKDGWALIPEDDTEHEFQGDAVLLNDKLTVVLRAKGPGAEVYSQAAGGPRFRAVVMSAPRKAVAVTGISSLRIVENSLGAVMVEADFQGDGQSGSCTAAYRLTTGQAMLQMTGAEAADRFFVWSVTRYVVVPDFFADDMVFDAATCDLNRFGLPAENFLLNLLDGGDAMLICVWHSKQQEAYAVSTGECPGRAIRGCEIEGGEQRSLWVALLEQPGIWHESSIVAKKGEASTIELDWLRPFEATWRANFLRPFGLARSWDFRSSREGEQPDANHQRYYPFREYPCWFDKDRAVVRIPEHPSAFMQPYQGPILPYPLDDVVVYPLDRTPATPLTAFCTTDILRSVLGVGPCQYVLRTEGLASETNPTPAHVMEWIEKQFEKKEEAGSAEEMEERLKQMADHVGRVQARIEEYVELERELQPLLPTDLLEGAILEFTVICGEMERAVAAGPETPQPSTRVAQLSEQILSLIGKDNAAEECRRLGEEVRRIGALQDRTLSRCRMLLRWLNQQARMWAIKEPANAELAREVQRRVERFLAQE